MYNINNNNHNNIFWCLDDGLVGYFSFDDNGYD